MKLKSFKTIKLMYVVVSASALITACHTKVTEPLKLMSGQSAIPNQNMLSSEKPTIVENYGVPQAQNVLFSNRTEDTSLDFTF